MCVYLCRIFTAKAVTTKKGNPEELESNECNPHFTLNW